MSKFVVEAVVAVIAVVEAYGSCEAVEEVAVRYGAVIVWYAVTAPRKSELPNTSSMLPVVVVAVLPRRRTREVTDGCIASESLVVEKKPAEPLEVRSACQEGIPPSSLSTRPSAPAVSVESVLPELP